MRKCIFTVAWLSGVPNDFANQRGERTANTKLIARADIGDH
jgi:hypothetical protein